MSVSGMGSIFVSVASYRDKMLLATLQDALDKADYPDRIIFGVVDQEYIEDRIHLPDAIRAQTRYLGLNPIDSRGVCWARSLVGTLYAGEKWFLQIDSHTLFSEGWDSYMIENLALCYQESRRPIITGFPSAFSIENGKVKYDARNDCIITTVVKEGTDFTSHEGYIVPHTITTVHDSFIPCFHLAGGYFFTSGSIVDAIPYDPSYYFSGEEHGLSIRMFTSGWDMFHTANTPLYHLYEAKYTETVSRVRHWDEKDDAKRTENKYKDLAAKAKARFQRLIKGDDLGVYSLGKERSLQEFADFSGVDYVNMVIREKAFGPLRGNKYAR